MNTKRLLGPALLVLLSACSAECSCGGDDDEPVTSSAGVGGNGSGETTAVGQGGAGTGTDTTTTGTDTGTSGSNTGSGGSGTGGGDTGGVSYRLAHLAVGSANYNFCFDDAESDESIGPIVSGGLAYEEFSEYGELHTGVYRVQMVAGDAADCADPIAESEPIDFDFGDAFTVAIIGDEDAEAGDPDEFGFAIFDDDLSPPSEGNVRARFIHAASTAITVGAIDVGYYEGEEFQLVWEAVEYPNDAGYIEIPGSDEPLTLVARATGTDGPDLFELEDVGRRPGTLVEGFAVGVDGGVGARVFTVTTEF